MNTTENNKLIAEFIGMQETKLGWFDNEEVLNLPYDPSNTFDDLLFHKSWDWLMPVIQKIMEYQHEKEDSELALIIRDSLCDVSITGTYDAVINFINWYNKNKED